MLRQTSTSEVVRKIHPTCLKDDGYQMSEDFINIFALLIEQKIIFNKKISIGIIVGAFEDEFGVFKYNFKDLESQNNKNAYTLIFKSALEYIKNKLDDSIDIKIIINEEGDYIDKYKLKENPLPVNIKLVSSNNDNFIIKDLYNQAYQALQEKFIEIQNREEEILKKWEDISPRYFRIQNTTESSIDRSILSQKLFSITGFYADDYERPVLREGGPIFNIISDDSFFDNHFCVGSIILPYKKHTYYEEIEGKLEELTLKYGLKNIHFCDIFGAKNILKHKKLSFIDEYCNIVSSIKNDSICISKSKNKDEILKELKDLSSDPLSDEQIYLALQIHNISVLAEGISEYSILHLYFEQNFSINYETPDELFVQKLQEQTMIIENIKHNPKYISICKHPHFIKKNAILFDSLSDLIAYASNKIQNKIDKNIPHNKIIKAYKPLLIAIKKIFANYSGLSSIELVNLINEA